MNFLKGMSSSLLKRVNPTDLSSHISACFRISFILVVLLLLLKPASAQLTGVKTIPGDYATVAAAVTALNSAGVGTDGVIFNVAANHTETIASTISLTATGIAANPIVFQKDPGTSGANPVITAYTGGLGTPGTTTQDGIWRLVGSDYVTIDGIDLRDNPANTTNPSTMEYGYALYKTSAADGCQNVTIQNCVITLNRINNATGTAPMVDGSTGILSVNSTPTAAITILTITTSGGTNSNNSFYNNTIQNCNTGIAIIGFAATGTFSAADQYNDIGGSIAATGNRILNFGGAPAAPNAAIGIRTLAQYNFNVAFNTINNNNGSGVNHVNSLKGIWINTATSASVDVTNNTITLKSAATTQAVSGIENAAGTTAIGNEINISNNTITNCTVTTATTGSFYGIYNVAATPGILTIVGNTITNNSTAATGTGVYYPIWNSGIVANTIDINNNIIGGITFTSATSMAFIGINNSAGNAASSLSISNNDISGITYSALSTAANTYIINSAATLSQTISSNTFTNLDVNTTGAITFISNSVILSTTGNQVVDDNSIVGSFTRTSTATTGALTIFNSIAANGSGSVISNSNNDFSNITVSGAASIAGWINTDAGASLKTIQGNTFANWNGGTGTITVLTTSQTGTTNAIVNNIINNINGGGLITGITTGAGNDNIYLNTISNLVSTGGTTTVVMGISVTAATTKNIYQNTISGLSANNSTTGQTTTLWSVNGISVSGGTTVNIYENKISALTANSITTGTVNGIAMSTGTTVTVYRNKIYNLSSTGAALTSGGVNGIRLSGAVANITTTIRNNMIGDLKATAASSATDVVRGISLISTGTTSNINVYYNTIYLNAVSSGTNFSTTGIFHAASATTTLAKLEMINNIIFNVSTPNGTGLTVAYRRSAANTLGNYATSSNNNLYYAGTPGATRLIFNDITNSDQTLAAFKTRMVAPRDANSVTEDLIAGAVFLSTVTTSVNYLHIDDSKSTVLKSGGVAIAGVSLDFDNEIRHGNTGYAGTGTAPDIGADEYAGITYVPLSGSYNVGTGQTFLSLTNQGGLFSKINRVGLSGHVIVNITSDLTETGVEALNEWAETGAGNYTLTIQPNNTSTRIISGDVLQGLIRLNGADRVIIDGGAGKYLTFRNTNTSGTTGTAITLKNGASNNIIRRCTLEAFTDINNGVLLFSTSATFDGGNSNNLVELCNINGTVGSNNATVCVLSAGTNISGFENTNNTITNNNIYDYRDRGLGIKSTGSYGWTITGNSFYNGSISGGINYAASSTLHGIRILGGNGYTITNNHIGGSAALATGANAVYSSSTGNVSYQGILLTSNATIPETNIKGNTISKISISSVPTVASSIAFYGIETNGSGINIGGSGPGEGNLIGSNTANAAITVSTNAGAITTLIRGIFCNSSGGQVIGNQVGGIDITNIGTTGASTLLGIYVNNPIAPTKVNNNIIGSTGAGAAANSIHVLSGSTSTRTALTGISIGTSVGSVVQLDSNIINNISHLSNAITLTAGGIIGINTAAKNTAEITITKNTIANMRSSSTMTTGVFYGIQNTGASAALKINNNTFSDNTIGSVSTVFTAIRNTGVIFNSIEINQNAIGTGSTAGAVFSAASTATHVFINNTGGSSGANLTISNNDFQNINYPGNNGNGINNYISNTAATLSQIITGNSFTNLNVLNAGSTTFITNSVIVPAAGSQNVSNNFISGTYTKKAGGTITLLTSAATCASGSTINITNNNFSNITVTGATVIAGLVNTDVGNSNKTIQGNIFTNWSAGTSAVTAMNINLTGANNATTGNIIRNISSVGTITGITTAAGNDNIYNNTIDSLFSTGTVASIVSGINVTAGTSKNIYQNTISNLRGNILTTGTVRGILISAGTTVNFYQNTIYGLTANALTTGTLSGIWVSAGTTVNISRNKIYDLSTSSTALTGQVYGIQVSGSVVNLVSNINNNIIGDLRVTTASNIDAIRGIGVTSTGNPSTTNVYYNTIYLNASSSGANFGTSGIYHAGGAAGVSTLELINNNITNLSVHKGTGLVVAYRRSANQYNNYGATSNNNMFYAGTPAANYLIFYDGSSSDQTLAAFKARVTPRETNSITEDLVGGTIFLSTTPSASAYLHIDQNKTTALRSAGVAISGFTDDFDGDIRFGNPGYSGSGTAPDIGADEFAGYQFLPFSGIYNVGTGQNYTSLTNTNGIFSKMNSLGFSGHVTINIVSDLTETGAEALNQWTEFGAGNYTLKIQPDAATPRLISGNVVAGLIRFNGADRVKIDGGTSRLLTFRNTNNSGTSGTAFTFSNNATYDTIRYCNLEAFANATNGVVLFSTAASGATGNSYNLLEYNNINGTVSGNSSLTAIYSSGTAGRTNANNVISNNNIYDFRDRGIDITATGSTGWTISNNSFYNGTASASVNYPASSELHGIRILGGSGYTVTNNYIGGNAALATGSNAAYATTLGNLGYQGILLTTTSATPASNIKGNTIAKISLTSTPISSGVNAFIGIETNGSGINIGGTVAGEGNLIGSNTANSSIIVNTSTTSTTYTSVIKGINCLSTGGLVTRNQVGGFDISNTGTFPAASAFTGIYVNHATAPTQVNSNIIGSTGAGAATNSIRVLAGSTALTNVLEGIEIGTSVASAVQLNANTIQNMANLSTSSSGSFTGINNIATVSGAVITITNNLIKNISAAANSNINSTIFTGINSTSPSAISTDTISNITYSATGLAAQIRGIAVSGAFAHSIYDNIIADLSTASTKTADVETGSPANYNISGILNSASVAGQLIYGNTLYNFTTSATDVTNTAIAGIGIVTAGFSGNIYRNRLVGFTNSATGTVTLPGITGIACMNGTGNVYNNVIRISNAALSNGLKLYGINHSASTAFTYFYNSVSIGGSAAGTAARSAAFIRTVNGAVNLKNNLLINTRAGTGSNYGLSNKVASPATNWSASNYNNIYSSTAGTAAEWGNGGNNTFAQWQTNSGGDANSVSKSVSFIASTYDLVPDPNSNCSINNSATVISTPLVINTDINGVTRHATTPDMGAYEFTFAAFTVTTSSNSPICSGSNLNLTSTFGTAISPTFSWNDPLYAIISTLQNPTVSGITGFYTVTVTDINGCAVLDSTAVTVHAIPAITGTTPASRCGTGTVSLGAAASAGTINWYAAPTGGSSLGTGTGFTTPTISTTTIYYVDGTANGCTTASRTAVTATVNDIPTITGTTPASRCGTGTVSLGATASAGTVNWYAASTGGASLGTGTGFTTPSISATTIYYVDGTLNGCTTAARTAVTATVNDIPTITGTTPASRCGTGTLSLGATSSAGTINWYAASTGGASLGTGTSFTTPSIAASTSYWTDATANGCVTGTRTEVIATVNDIPTITGTTPDSRCGTGTLSLGASASAGTINWYAASTGGASLGTGTSFTTPSISATTIYYTDATENGCTTAARTAVTATINDIPTITGTTPASRCGTGTLSLGATTSAGSIDWYAGSNGGPSLGTGTSFTTPSISSTTSYWVEATNNGCSIGTRTEVIATVNDIPTISGTTPASRCGTGTVDLGATATAGTINWYAASTGGASLGTGTGFTTPSISATTSYWVDATDNGCVTGTRTEVIATINDIPTITGTNPGIILGPGTVNLDATASAGIIDWYTASTGGSSIYTGTGFTTPSISATTSYWVEATSGGCTTATRTEVIATIASINGSQNIVCPNQVVNYTLSNAFDTYQWTVTGGTPTSGTSSNINVTWGTGNRGQLTIEAFNSGLSKGIISRRIYIDQPSVFTATADTNICVGGSASPGLSFANKSLSLNGTTDYVGIANSALINLGKTDYRTVSMWFKANDVTTRQVLYNEGGATNGFSMYIDGGKVYVLAWESNSAWNAPNASINTGQWYNITFVFDEDATDGYHFKGYLDGVSIGEFNEGAKASNGMNAHSGPVAIGSNSNIRFHDNTTSANNYFNGKVDGFKLWNRSLTVAEILIEKDHWLSSPVIDAALDVYINFDNSVLDVADTPSAEDGALFGSPTYDDDAPLVPTILWSPGGATTSTITVSPAVTTAYNFTLTEKLSAACGQNGSINVTVTPLPTITGTTPDTRCGTGTVTLGATASAGTINWYAASTGGTSLGTGTSFTTPSISSTTTYYVEAVTAIGCTTASRTAVTATVDAAPTSSFSYAGSPYCGNGGIANVTFSGTTGGTYSSTAGLDIHPTTGDITLANSTDGTYKVTYTVTGGCAPHTDSAYVTIKAIGIWLGTTSTDWNNTANWQCSTIAGATNNVIIGNGLSFYPTLSSGTASVNNITIASGGSLTVTGATLQIAGAVTNSGTFTASAGTIEFNGTAAQTIPAIAYDNLTLSGGNTKTLAGNISITNTLLPDANTTLALGNFDITLKSTATTIARIGNTPSTANITYGTGRFIVERYVPGRRKYRLFTSSVTSSDNATLTIGEEALSIWGNWQNSGNNVTQNIGTIITGGSSADGFDTQTTNASMFNYDDVNRAFVGHTSLNGKNTKYTPLKAGKAYYLFVYGDRTNTIFTSNPKNTTISSRGKILTGDQAYTTGSSNPLSGVTNRYTLLGNPFASPVNWATVTRTNISNTFWGWDPNLNSTGGYVTVSTTGLVTLIAPFSGTVGLNQYIQPGQGFLVKTTGAAPTMTIKESDKVPNFNNIAFFTEPQENPVANNIPLLAINLLYPSGANMLLADGSIAAFDKSFSNSVGTEDASKLTSSTEVLAILNGTELLSIDARKMPENKDTLFINMQRITRPTYTLQIFANQMTGSTLTPILIDNYLSTSTNLSLTDTNRIVFSIVSGVPASSASNRFKIVFRDYTVLPVVFRSVKAAQKNKDIQVDWSVAEESSTVKYQVEHSLTGAGFTVAGELTARGIAGNQDYQWLHISPEAGNHFYRIKAINADGKFVLSNIVLVKSEPAAAAEPAISVFPNPVLNQQINLLISNMAKGQYPVQLMNVQGQVLFAQTISHNGGTASQVIGISKTILPGIYYLQVVNGGTRYTQTIHIN